MNAHHLREYLGQVNLNTGIEPIVHEQLCEHLRYYFFIGGLPAVVKEYISSNQLERVQAAQLNLLQSYRDDFGKYASKAKHQYMQKILYESPALIGDKFSYSRIDSSSGSREIKQALEYLLEAGLLYKVRHTSASGLPLNAQIKERNFKIIFLDIGLANSRSYLSPALFFQNDLMLLNRGKQAEQFCGQELLAYRKPYLQNELFYWDREKPSSTAEIDYIINVNEQIIPIEVKAGKTGSLRSLQLFLNEKHYPYGLRISLNPLEFSHRVLSVPLYMISEIPRLVTSIDENINPQTKS